MIKQNKVFKTITYGLILAVYLPLACNDLPDNIKKPNIIIIYADDLGYGDLTTYGGDIPSPNIQRIADAGVRFTDFYVGGPVCTPSRYSLLTGNYPERSVHNLTGALMPEDTGHIDKTEKLLPQYLKEFGYRTALFGKWHLGNSKPEYLPCNYGFDKFVGHSGGCIDYYTHVYGSLEHDWYKDCQPLSENGFSTDLITKHAIEYLSKKDDNPYFAFISYNAPHYGKSDPNNLPDNTIILLQGNRQGIDYANTLQAPEEYVQRFSHNLDIYRRYYSAMVSNMDDNIGKILDFLEKSGKIANTIIWFISDNGGYSESYFQYASNGVLRGEKGDLTEGGIRVPSVVSWKGVLKPGKFISQPVVNIDLMPTFMNIIDPDYTKTETGFDGISLVPLLFNNEEKERDIFWKYRDQKAFRRGDWKLVNNRLYDLSKDISEQTDLSDTNPTKYEELHEA